MCHYIVVDMVLAIRRARRTVTLRVPNGNSAEVGNAALWGSVRHPA